MMGISLVVGLAFTPQTNAQWVGGPVLIGGDETDSSVVEGTSQSGKIYAIEAFDFLGREVTNGHKVAVCIGCNDAPDIAKRAFEASFDASGLPGPPPGFGWTRFSLATLAGITAFFDGTGAVNVNNTGIIYMPSRFVPIPCPADECGSIATVFGGIEQDQLNLVNANKAILKDFVKGTNGVGGGGGLFTHQLDGMVNAYEWLTDPDDGLVPEIQADVPTSEVDDLSLVLSCNAETAFFPGITANEVLAISGPHPWFTRFEDKPGFTGLGGLTPVARSNRIIATGAVIGDIIVLGGPLPPPAIGPDCDADGLPDVCTDCNLNGVPDTCDIATGSPDCDGNGVLDECNDDCNENGVPDDCDIQDCLEGAPACGDCDLDGVMNSCEIQECPVGDNRCADCDSNGIPDVCDGPQTPLLPASPHDIRKNRFVSFDPNNCANVAFKLELLDRTCSLTGLKCMVDADCKRCVGGSNHGFACTINSECLDGGTCGVSGETCVEQTPPVLLGWVDDPFAPSPPRTPPGTFAAAVVGMMPPLRQWTEGVVHVTGCVIAPAQTYAISATADGVIFSDPLLIGTIVKPVGKAWADLVGNFNGTSWTPPNGFVGVDDVSAILKYITLQPAPHITVLDLDAEVPNFLINATDLGLVLKAFKGGPYPPPITFATQGPVTDCPGVPSPPIIGSGPPSLFTLVPNSAFIDSDGTVRVDVFVDDVTDLGAYDLALEVTGGTNGTLTLVEIVIESFCMGGTDDGKLCAVPADCASPGVCVVRPDYVFASGGGIEGCDTVGGRIANVNSISGVAVTGSGYLGTFVYQATGCAEGDFTIAMKPGDEVTFINNGDGLLLPTTPDLCSVIGVGYDCFDAADCDPIACQTATCVSNACNYANDPSGTSCDDGEYCTTTDTCDGNGFCVGSGTPCYRPPNISCCESTDSCYDDAFLLCPLQFP